MDFYREQSMTAILEQGMSSSERLKRAFADVRDGRLDQAREAFVGLMHDDEAAVDCRRGLASISWRNEQREGAIQLLKDAVRLDEQHADARADLALLLMLSGELDESLLQWEVRLRLMPDDASAWHNYAKALAEVRRYPDAANAFERALASNPTDERTYVTYASTMVSAGNARQAEVVLRRGLELIHADRAEAIYSGLADVLAQRGKLDESIELYRAAVGLLPASSELHMGFGQLLEDAGDRLGAEAAYRKALALRPGWAFPVGHLLTLLRKNAAVDEIRLAQDILADTERPPQDHAMVGFGLGKALDDQGDYGGAFNAWRDANDARQRQVGRYDPAFVESRVDRTIAVFNEDFFRNRSDWGSTDPRPMFVIGMPRSGTTLIEQILSAHPDVHAYGELTEIPSIAKRLRARSGSIQRWPEAAVSVGSDAIGRVAGEYLDALSDRYESSASRFVDKAPMNFFHLGLISIMFSNARFIWCKRDPRDICLSIYAENFSLNHKYATDLKSLGSYYRQHARLMRHWGRVLAGRIYAVEYEDVVADPECASRRLLDALDLPWNSNCLRFHENDRAVSTPSRWQVRAPIYRSAVSRWERYRAHLTPLYEGLGDEVGD